MPRKAATGQFTPKNPQKYLGGNIKNITYRSSWELTMMMHLDQHPNVKGWMSESLPSNHVHKGLSGIPYEHPFRVTQNGRRMWTFYVPDFFVIYDDVNGRQHQDVIEVKPSDEVPGYSGRVSKLKEGRQIINAAKYAAAAKYCKQYGFTFKICTEKDIFALQPNKRKR